MEAYTMNFGTAFNISSDIQKQLDVAYENRQTMVNAAAIQEGSTAKQVALNLYQEIVKYQASLPDTEDVIMMLVQFGHTYTIRVTNIGYSGYTLVCFHGEDIDGKPLELIQHISQLNFLLQVQPKEKPEIPKRKIGFVGEVD